MAQIPLKSIKFPGLSDTYIVPQIDPTLTHSGQAADAKAAGDEISDLKSALDQRLPMTNDGRTLLQSGDDLNNCTVGVYVCQTTDIAETLLNSPVQTGFRLNVFLSSSSTALTFILITTGGHIWWRAKGSSFYKWKEVANVEDLLEDLQSYYNSTEKVIDKLRKSLGSESVMRPAMERGGINSETGEKHSATNRIRTQDFIPTDNVMSIIAPNGGVIAVSYYDSNYTFLNATSFLDSVDDLPTGDYVKIVVRKSDDSAIYADESYSPIIKTLEDISTSSVAQIELDEEKLIKAVCPPTNMEQGSISGTGEEQSSSTRIRSIAYIPTHNLKSVKVGEGYQYTVISYDHNLAFMATTGWITEERTAFYSDYIRLVIARSDGENITPAEDTGLVLERMESAPQVSINMLKDAYSPDQMTSGCTFVGNDLWCFIAAADDGSNYGDVYILSYDITTNTLTHLRTIQHNLGHVNSVSYCEETDTLICGNGSNVYNLSGKIFILQGAASKTRLERSDCIEIDVGFNFGFKVNCVWGDKNVNRHDIAYICSNDSHSIYRIQLGQGTHDLGSGVLVEGATGFNGTYKVLNSWSWGFVGRDYDNVIQGMVFWKNRLIWGYGHNNGFSVRLAKLYEGGRIEVETANYKTTDADGEVLERYMAGMVKFGDNEEYLGICASRHLLVIKDWN